MKSPLTVGIGKKKFTLNLNQYRNAHYRITNTAKIRYKELMKEQILSVKGKLGRSLIIYTIYKGDNRRFDVGNICSIHQKFFEDALVELSKLEDDKHSILPVSIFQYGGIDKDNPRVDITIIELTKKKVLDKKNICGSIKILGG